MWCAHPRAMIASTSDAITIPRGRAWKEKDDSTDLPRKMAKEATATRRHAKRKTGIVRAHLPRSGPLQDITHDRFGVRIEGRRIRNRVLQMVQKPVRELLANDLWRRILITLGLVAITRLGHFLPLPGFDRRFLPPGFLSPVTGVLDGLGDMSSEVSLNVMQLGISPYIGASIITQVACVFVPWFVRQRKEEGAAGMDAINRVTKYIALGIALLQSAYLALVCSPFTVMTRFYFLTTTLLLTAGSMIVMFIAEAITEHGIGNGTTIIICLSILAGYASAMDVMVQKIMMRSVPVSYLVGTLAFFVTMTLGGIFVTETMRKVPISYFQIEGGRRTPASLHGEQTKYIPFKINPTGMQPVLVAAYALDFPRWIAQLTGSTVLQNFSRVLDPTIPALPGANPVLYYIVYFMVVFGSTFIDLESTPKEASEYLMKVGARVKGVRPGFQTVEFFRRVRTSTRFWGGILLGILATVSAVFDSYMRNLVGSYIGCTSLLIVVGMIISTKRQIQAYHQLPVLDRILQGELSGAGVSTSPSKQA